MKLPPMNLRVFCLTGAFIFASQAALSVVMFFLSLSSQTVWSGLYTWSGVFFGLMMSYFFLTSAPPKSEPLSDFDVQNFIKEVEKEAKK